MNDINELHWTYHHDFGVPDTRIVRDLTSLAGLADGIPVFIISDLSLQTDDGEVMARIELYEPVNEDPAFSLYFKPETMPATLRVKGRDNNGNRIDGMLTAGETH